MTKHPSTSTIEPSTSTIEPSTSTEKYKTTEFKSTSIEVSLKILPIRCLKMKQKNALLTLYIHFLDFISPNRDNYLAINKLQINYNQLA